MIVATLLAGCGASAPTSHGARIPAKATPTTASKTAFLAPSGFQIRPDIADPRCNGGRGVSLRGPFGGRRPGPGYEEIVSVRAGTLADSSTLIAFSSYSPGKSLAVLDALLPTCTWDTGFGDGGTAKIAIPTGFRTEHAPDHNEEGRASGPEGLVIEAVAARNGGGAILAGSYKGAWLVGEITARGQLDPTFGNGGWSPLPFEGAVTNVLQEPSGRIIIAGGEHFSGCCTVNWGATLSASGKLERSFGTHGRVELPTGESSGIQELLREPDGDILVDVGGGNMGCWSTSLALFTAFGRPVPRFAWFAGQPGRFWRGLSLHAFSGDTYIEGEGFTVIGTGERPCHDEPPGSRAPATGILASFRSTGTLAGPVVRFPSQMYNPVQAFPDGHGVVLAESPYSDKADLTLKALRPDGSTDPRFGSRGHAQVQMPWSGPRLEVVSVTRASRTEIVVVATKPESNQVQVIRVLL